MKLLAVAAFLVAVQTPTLVAPAVVFDHIDSVKPVDAFAHLPPGIRSGSFMVDNTPAKGWVMSEPGGPFQATDVVTPGSPLPGRRMIFAACDATVCLLHYERGGIAHVYEVLAFKSGSNGWSVVWNARGPKPLANLAALKAMVKHTASAGGWTNEWVPGNF